MTDTVTPETESPLAAAGTGTVVSWHAERRPDQLAIVSDFGDRTYAELDAAANRPPRPLYPARPRPRRRRPTPRRRARAGLPQPPGVPGGLCRGATHRAAAHAGQLASH